MSKIIPLVSDEFFELGYKNISILLERLENLELDLSIDLIDTISQVREVVLVVLKNTHKKVELHHLSYAKTDFTINYKDISNLILELNESTSKILEGGDKKVISNFIDDLNEAIRINNMTILSKNIDETEKEKNRKEKIENQEMLNEFKGKLKKAEDIELIIEELSLYKKDYLKILRKNYKKHIKLDKRQQRIEEEVATTNENLNESSEVEAIIIEAEIEKKEGLHISEFIGYLEKITEKGIPDISNNYGYSKSGKYIIDYFNNSLDKNLIISDIYDFTFYITTKFSNGINNDEELDLSAKDFLYKKRKELREFVTLKLKKEDSKLDSYIETIAGLYGYLKVNGGKINKSQVQFFDSNIYQFLFKNVLNNETGKIDWKIIIGGMLKILKPKLDDINFQELELEFKSFDGENSKKAEKPEKVEKPQNVITFEDIEVQLDNFFIENDIKSVIKVIKVAIKYEILIPELNKQIIEFLYKMPVLEKQKQSEKIKLLLDYLDKNND